MSGKSDYLELGYLQLLFNGTNLANIADNAATAPSTNFWVSLHTADPTDAGDQGASEVTYTPYARVSVDRTTAGWVVGTGTVSPAAAITFPQVTSTGTETASYFGVGLTSASTAGNLLYSGAISPTIGIAQNVTPSLTTGSSITED